MLLKKASREEKQTLQFQKYKLVHFSMFQREPKGLRRHFSRPICKIIVYTQTTFRCCCVHFCVFSDKLSRNSCILPQTHARFLSIIRSIPSVTVNYARICFLDVSTWMLRYETSFLYLSFTLFHYFIYIKEATFGESLLS